MLRWNLRERGRFHPFIELAGGVLVTNREVPEGTTRMNFVSHAGAGARVRIAEQSRVMAGYLFIGLQIGPIVENLEPGDRGRYFMVAGAVLVTVIVVRLAWHMSFEAVVGGSTVDSDFIRHGRCYGLPLPTFSGSL